MGPEYQDSLIRTLEKIRSADSPMLFLCLGGRDHFSVWGNLLTYDSSSCSSLWLFISIFNLIGLKKHRALTRPSFGYICEDVSREETGKTQGWQHLMVWAPGLHGVGAEKLSAGHSVHLLPDQDQCPSWFCSPAFPPGVGFLSSEFPARISLSSIRLRFSRYSGILMRKVAGTHAHHPPCFFYLPLSHFFSQAEIFSFSYVFKDMI